MQGQLDPCLSYRPGEPRPLVPKGGGPVYMLSRYPGLIGARCSELRILSNESKTALSPRPWTNICHRNCLGASGSGERALIGPPSGTAHPGQASRRQAGRRPAPACTQCPMVSSNPLPRGKKKTRPAEWVILPRLPAGAVAGTPAAHAFRWVVIEVQPDELDTGRLHSCVHCVSRAGPGGSPCLGLSGRIVAAGTASGPGSPRGPRPRQRA